MSNDPTTLEQAQFRVCRTCGEQKPHSDYPRQEGCRDGIRPSCKACHFGRYREAKIASCRKWRRDNPHSSLWSAARGRARALGLPFTIQPEDIVIPERCPAIGIPLGGLGGPRRDDTPSLDRIVPARGYVPGNIAVISWRANRIKSDSTMEELEALVDYLARRVPPKQTRRKTRNPA